MSPDMFTFSSMRNYTFGLLVSSSETIYYRCTPFDRPWRSLHNAHGKYNNCSRGSTTMHTLFSCNTISYLLMGVCYSRLTNYNNTRKCTISSRDFWIAILFVIRKMYACSDVLLGCILWLMFVRFVCILVTRVKLGRCWTIYEIWTSYIIRLNL